MTLVVGALLFTGVTAVRKSPFSTVEAFYVALDQGRNDDAIAHLSFDARSRWEALAEDRRQQLVGKLTRDRTITNLEFAKVKIGGNEEKRARVALFVTYENDGFEVKTHDLIWQDGHWKLTWPLASRVWNDSLE